MFPYEHYVVRESPVLWKHAAQVSRISELGLMFWPDVSVSAGTVPEIWCVHLHVKLLLALIESCCSLCHSRSHLPKSFDLLWDYIFCYSTIFLYDLQLDASTMFKTEKACRLGQKWVSLMPFPCLFLLKQAGVRGTLGRLLGVFEVRLPNCLIKNKTLSLILQ